MTTTFPQFLLSQAIFTKQHIDALGSTLDDGNKNRCVSKLTDFFTVLSPSDAYDLASRLYLLWNKGLNTIPERQRPAKLTASDIISRRMNTSPNSSYLNNTTGYSSPQNRVASPKPKSPEIRINSYTNTNARNRNHSPDSSIFDKLYSDAQRKNSMQQIVQENKVKVEAQELQACTFQPNYKGTANYASSGEVFDRLGQDLRPAKQQISQLKKLEIEMRNCTFTPTINSTSLTEDERYYSAKTNKRVFDRLYNDELIKRHHRLENEVAKQELELAGCTFKPLMSPGSRAHQSRVEGGEEGFDRLYKQHERKQHALTMKRQALIEQEIGKCTFHPQTTASSISSVKNTTEKKQVVDRLLDWYTNKKMRSKQKAQTEVSPREGFLNINKKRALNDSCNTSLAYDRLYQDHSNKRVREAALEKKFNKEAGISFTPKTNKSRTRTRSLSLNKSKEKASTLFGANTRNMVTSN